MHRGTIVVADDCMVTRAIFGGLLLARNFEVLTTDDGQGVIPILARLKDIPLAIISDISMLNMDGLTLHNTLQSTIYKDVPFILCSTRTVKGFLCLRKPIIQQALDEMLKEIGL